MKRSQFLGGVTMAYVYILRCGDRSLYTGATLDVMRRLGQHQSGRGAKYTRSRLPVELVFAELCGDWAAALRREREIKRLERRQKLALIQGDWETVLRAAEGQNKPQT
ncbi:MAG: GIY-YIG nuclease family protein [Cyanophyceae cyanobacterium]